VVESTHVLALQHAELARDLIVLVKADGSASQLELIAPIHGRGCPNLEAKARASGDCQDLYDPPPAKIPHINATLPPGAQTYRQHSEGFQDETMQVRFELDSADLPTLVARLPCRLGPLSTGAVEYATVGRKQRWYTPEAAKRHRGCRFPNTPSGSVLIDQTSAPRPVVYVVVNIH
jgi:hypothetical protein